MNDYTGMDSDHMFGDSRVSAAEVEQETQIAQIMKRLARLEQMLEERTNPYIYPGDTTPQPYVSYTPNACERCGVVFEGVMSYSCPDLECPIQMRTTC